LQIERSRRAIAGFFFAPCPIGEMSNNVRRLALWMGMILARISIQN